MLRFFCPKKRWSKYSNTVILIKNHGCPHFFDFRDPNVWCQFPPSVSSHPCLHQAKTGTNFDQADAHQNLPGEERAWLQHMGSATAKLATFPARGAGEQGTKGRRESVFVSSICFGDNEPPTLVVGEVPFCSQSPSSTPDEPV